MSYREVAKELNVHYLVGRWGLKFWNHMPGEKKAFKPSLVPLDGWSFNPQEIIEALVNDPAFSIKYEEKK